MKHTCVIQLIARKIYRYEIRHVSKHCCGQNADFVIPEKKVRVNNNSVTLVSGASLLHFGIHKVIDFVMLRK